MNNPTICANCNHYVFLNDLPDAKYLKREDLYHLCKASKLETIDYVTGRTSVIFKYCRTKNLEGNCPDFESKEKPNE